MPPRMRKSFAAEVISLFLYLTKEFNTSNTGSSIAGNNRINLSNLSSEDSDDVWLIDDRKINNSVVVPHFTHVAFFGTV